MNNEALERFYEKLATVKDRKWTVDKLEHIRADGKWLNCPLAIAGENESFVDAGKSFGLNDGECFEIALAADCTLKQHPELRPVRARMLEILGLQEVSA